MTKNKQMEKGLSLRKKISLPSPTGRGKPRGRLFLYASLNLWRQAGLVVEAALLLPLFFLSMITMIGFMDLYGLQAEKLTELCQAAQEAGMYAAAAGGETADITLPSLYSYQAPISVIPLPKLWISGHVKVRAWTGVLNNGQGEGDTETETMVYMTENGTVYHGKNCSYLRPSVEAVSGGQVEELRNQAGGKYYPCEHCSRGQAAGGTIYITRNGSRYHNSAQCSSLRRLARLVKLSEVEGKIAPCSRCGGR